MKYLSLILLLSLTITLQAQIAINTTGQAPDTTAILDISSQEKGVLLPRLSVSQRDEISSPAEGLLVFNTTTGTIDMYHDGGWYSYLSTPSTTLPTVAMPDYNMVVLPQDAPNYMKWGTSFLPFSATSTDGSYNTEIIISNYGIDSNYAARYCKELDTLGYNWYLPSFVELDSLFQNKDVIEGFEDTLYWSSKSNGVLANFTNCSASCQQLYLSCNFVCNIQNPTQGCYDECSATNQSCMTNCHTSTGTNLTAVIDFELGTAWDIYDKTIEYRVRCVAKSSF